MPPHKFARAWVRGYLAGYQSLQWQSTVSVAFHALVDDCTRDFVALINRRRGQAGAINGRLSFLGRIVDKGGTCASL